MIGALADAEKVIQDKMIELCTNCDADWGKRLADGIKAAQANMEAEGGNQYNERQGTEAVQHAEEMAHDAKPY